MTSLVQDERWPMIFGRNTHLISTVVTYLCTQIVSIAHTNSNYILVIISCESLFSHVLRSATY